MRTLPFKYSIVTPLHHSSIIKTPNSTLEQKLRDPTLADPKLHLACAQDKMKKMTNQQHKDVEYAVGDGIYLKIQPYCLRSLP